jgi:hypothetical protein
MTTTLASAIWTTDPSAREKMSFAFVRPGINPSEGNIRAESLVFAVHRDAFRGCVRQVGLDLREL